MNTLKTGWMEWNEIALYKDQLIVMERELIVTYHYPDWDISLSYLEQSVSRLEDHIKSGNTFFWGVRDVKTLYGYYWGYASLFIDIKRWNIRSMMFLPEVKGLGYGKMSMEAGHQKAIELGCTEAATEYAPFNDNMATFMEKMGYVVKRIEVVKKL